jgi:serine/threonine-protein kinase
VSETPASDSGPRLLGDRYEVRHELGSGGTAVVHEGWDRVNGVRVAIKRLDPAATRRSRARMRFEREIRMGSQLRIPGIVQVLDHGEGPVEGAWLVMDFVEGEPLDQWLQRRGQALSPEEAVARMLPVVEAVEQLHQAGVLHRDVKPSNLMVPGQAGGRLLLIDLGLALEVASPSVNDARGEARLVGSPHYMAPEQALGQGASEASDVFALGLCLLELLMGRHPLAEFSEQDVLLAFANLEREVPMEGPWVQTALGDVLRRALFKTRRGRYASAAALAADLRSWQRGEPTEATSAAARGDSDLVPARTTEEEEIEDGLEGTSPLAALLVPGFLLVVLLVLVGPRGCGGAEAAAPPFPAPPAAGQGH